MSAIDMERVATDRPVEDEATKANVAKTPTETNMASVVETNDSVEAQPYIIVEARNADAARHAAANKVKSTNYNVPFLAEPEKAEASSAAEAQNITTTKTDKNKANKANAIAAVDAKEVKKTNAAVDGHAAANQVKATNYNFPFFG